MMIEHTWEFLLMPAPLWVKPTENCCNDASFFWPHLPPRAKRGTWSFIPKAVPTSTRPVPTSYVDPARCAAWLRMSIYGTPLTL